MSDKLVFKKTAVLILLAAAFLRLFLLQEMPPGLSRDEALNADIVSFIWQGQHALFFREGYGHEPLYHYLAAPLQPLLGDNYLAIRLPSVYIGLLLTAVTLRWTRREFDPVTALTAGALVAVSWQPIIFSRIGLRPILEPLLLLLMAWFWPRHPAKAGLFLGLAVYTYTAARAALLIPFLLLAWIFFAMRGKISKVDAERVRQLLKPTIVMLLTALLLVAPLFLALQFDPTLQERIDQLSGPLDAVWAGNLKPILTTTVATLGAFSFTGDPLSSYALPNRPFFDPFTSLLFFGGLILALWRWRQPRMGLLLVWLAAALIPSAVTPDAPSIIRLAGVMPVVYVLPAVALSWVWKQLARRDKVWRVVGMVAITAVIGLNLGRTIQDGFIQWPSLPETRLKYRSVLLDISRHWTSEGRPPLVVADSWYEPVKRDVLRRDIGFALPARWVQQGRAIVFPAGEAGGDNGRFYIPEYAPTDPQLLQMAGLTQPLFQSQNYPAFTLYALPKTLSIPLLPKPAEFDDAITLLGVEWHHSTPDNQIYLISYWRVKRPLPEDLAAFVHIISANGDVVAQHDGLDAIPSTLHPGDTFIQLHPLPLPDSPPSGRHTLQIGLYTRQTGQRLNHAGNPADRLILTSDLHLDGG